MIKSVFRAVAGGPKFRGKTKVLRTLHRLSGHGPMRSPYGPLIGNRPDDVTNFYYVSGMDETNYGDVYREVSALSPGSCFLDVGANAGLFSMVASPIVGMEGLVIAFEPSIAVFAELVRNANLNRIQNILPINAAIGAATAAVNFRAGEGGHTGIGHLDPQGDVRVWQVRFADLLPLLEPLIGSRPVVAKIDVEGAEAVVVESMLDFLSRPQVRKIIVEIDDHHLERFGSSARNLYSMLEGAGFRGLRGMGADGHYNEIFVR